MIFLPLVQGSAEWIDARLALPTASQFHRIITPAKGLFSKSAGPYRDELLAEMVLGYPVVDAESGFMTRGRDMEEDARSWYELQREVDLLPGGFILTDDGRAGASPDNLVGEEGVVEIKCPALKHHIGYLLDGLGDDHRVQVQAQLMISGRAWGDVVIYGPALPPRVFRVTRDEEFIGKMRLALTQFCEMLDAGRRELEKMGVRFKLQRGGERSLKLVG